MNLEFKELEASDMRTLSPIFSYRPNRTCDSGYLDCFLWKDYYHIKYCLVDSKAILWKMGREGQETSAMPLCREEELPYYFDMTRNYFNECLGRPLKMNLADEEAVRSLGLEADNRYQVREEVDLKDYLYDGEAMRTLAGKKLHKKKNLVNKFKRMYEGHWEYQSLGCSDIKIIWEFLKKWYGDREDFREEAAESLEYEIKGIYGILQDCCALEFKSGGIFLDGRLEAFSIGNYNPREEMAIIDIEKANHELPGIYQVINQEFLLHEFPQAKLVNREDDLGLEGLRKAKLSYHPVDYARKYAVQQLEF